MNENKKIGRRLAYLREGRTQQAVADALGLDRTTLVKLETGALPLSAKSLIKLAEYYKVSTDFILCLKGTEQKKLTSIIEAAPIDGEDKTVALEIVKEVKSVICTSYCKHEVKLSDGAVPELCVGCPIRKL